MHTVQPSIQPERAVKVLPTLTQCSQQVKYMAMTRGHGLGRAWPVVISKLLNAPPPPFHTSKEIHIEGLLADMPYVHVLERTLPNGQYLENFL
jgi:hypothetical protein